MPPSLLSFMRLLTCPNSANNNDADDTTFAPAISLKQLVQFNSTLQRKDISKTHHKADKETPLSIYVALLIHAETRSKLLIKKLHEHGLCISYHRMFSLSTSIGNSICAQLKKMALSVQILCVRVYSLHMLLVI